MKYQSVRFSGGLTWSAPWPDGVPPLRSVSPARSLHIPIAAGCESAVLEAGTLVEAGTALWTAGPGQSTGHAPVSGRVGGVTRVKTLDGREVAALQLDPSEKTGGLSIDLKWAHDLEPESSPAELVNRPGLLERLRQAGVSARRGTSPDLIEQLGFERKIDAILCNLLDPDPPLRLSAVLAHHAGAAIARGLALLAGALGARRVIVMTELGAPGKWFLPLELAAKNKRFVLTQTPHRYPQADPSLIIHGALKKRLGPGESPAQIGVLLIDAAGAAAVGRQAGRIRPELSVPLAVRDVARDRSSYLLAPIGMSVGDVMAQLQLDADRHVIRAGDTLREHAVPGDAVIADGESCLHVLPRPAAVVPDPCIRCGWCAESCPTRVQPAGLLEAAQRDDVRLAVAYGINSCIGCGVCGHVCPSRLPLLAAIRSLKGHASTAKAGGGRNT